MGEAYVTQATDITALYWNPAGLGVIPKSQFLVNHYDYIADLNFDYSGIVLKLPRLGAVGFHITYLSSPDIERTTLLQQEGTGEKVSAASYAVALSYGKALTDRFSIGFSAKYVQERIWHSVARGAALDFGTMFRTDAFNGLTIVAVLTNYGTDMRMMGRDQDIVYDPDPDAEGNNGTIPAKYTTDWWALPLNFRFGLATELIQTDFLTLAMEVDALHPSNNYESIDIGIEATILKTLFLRGGFSSLLQKDSIEGLSLGGGVKIPLGRGSVLIDYGYRDFGHLGFLQAITANFSL